MLRMLHSLPKPILFGLYGALGGLLGALLFGELIWALVRPTVAQAVPLKLAASPSVTAFWAGPISFTSGLHAAGSMGPCSSRRAICRPMSRFARLKFPREK